MKLGQSLNRPEEDFETGYSSGDDMMLCWEAKIEEATHHASYSSSASSLPTPEGGCTSQYLLLFIPGKDPTPPLGHTKTGRTTRGGPSLGCGGSPRVPSKDWDSSTPPRPPWLPWHPNSSQLPQYNQEDGSQTSWPRRKVNPSNTFTSETRTALTPAIMMSLTT
jgi:hypothetical protein